MRGGDCCKGCGIPAAIRKTVGCYVQDAHHGGAVRGQAGDRRSWASQIVQVGGRYFMGSDDARRVGAMYDFDMGEAKGATGERQPSF